MGVPDWIWFVFVFAFGCCVGSFLNVVVYRLPRDKSLVKPGSACPSCGRHIRFYDNIPLVSWVVLGAKCRYCRARISPRYFIIELLTGSVFTGLCILYFRVRPLAGLPPFLEGGWFVYVFHIILLGSLIAASAIDLELWVIPISICWLATAVGVIGSGLGVYVIEPSVIDRYSLLPSASANTASLAAGAVIGLAISCVLLASGLLKRSYESGEAADSAGGAEESAEPQFNPVRSESPGPTGVPAPPASNGPSSSNGVNHRLEMCREIVFLLPIIICSLAAYWISTSPLVHSWWVDFSQKPAIAGLLGSLWGYFVGCAVVWTTRIFGTLGFGKEAMGLGDVHLMGAAGAVIGPVFVFAAFFVAPFFGLAWAGFQMFFKKTRQIPYGPFLSLGILAVMILHDWIFSYWNLMRYH